MNGAAAAAGVGVNGSNMDMSAIGDNLPKTTEMSGLEQQEYEVGVRKMMSNMVF
jgi:hypothetical protein